ncbi:unnamed protein product [Ambrosiozyma monospora]|uniref:Unnamed protein product n=1 Tax=Ambrosiozyma monospora TaxID=43982 RepID=A0A9W6YVY0_AMBMO|nr:unnamed protein product [Ambrosiozyma monospora]
MSNQNTQNPNASDAKDQNKKLNTAKKLVIKDIDPIEFLTNQINEMRATYDKKVDQLLISQGLLVTQLVNNERKKVVNEVNKSVSTLTKNNQDPMQFFKYWLELAEYLNNNGYSFIVDKFEDSDFTMMEKADEELLRDIIMKTTSDAFKYHVQSNRWCLGDEKVSYLKVLDSIKQTLEVGVGKDEASFKSLFAKVKFSSFQDIQEPTFNVRITKMFLI